MKNPVWTNAIKSCADPQRAKQFLELLAATSAGTALQASSAEQARILAALFSGSRALSNLLVARPGAPTIGRGAGLGGLGWGGRKGQRSPQQKRGPPKGGSRCQKPLLAASD